MEDSRTSIARDRLLSNRCKTCKYWDKVDQDASDAPLRYCLLAQQYDKDFMASFGVINGEPFNEGVFATGPEFGCIHHTTT